jgi:hypothetical protein
VELFRPRAAVNGGDHVAVASISHLERYEVKATQLAVDDEVEER